MTQRRNAETLPVDINLISSDHETLALPALEAMALGRPVVTTRCGGPESLVQNANDGEIAAENTDEALAAALSRLLDRISSIDSETIRRNAAERFSERAVAQHWRAIYLT